MSIETLRLEYRIVERHATYDNISREEFRALVRAQAKGNAPIQILNAAKCATMPCKRCAGTGKFVTMMVDGKPTGPGGICFRCEGKGFQTWKDGRRNRYRDEQSMARACAEMAKEGGV